MLSTSPRKVTKEGGRSSVVPHVHHDDQPKRNFQSAHGFRIFLTTHPHATVDPPPLLHRALLSHLVSPLFALTHLSSLFLFTNLLYPNPLQYPPPPPTPPDDTPKSLLQLATGTSSARQGAPPALCFARAPLIRASRSAAGGGARGGFIGRLPNSRGFQPRSKVNTQEGRRSSGGEFSTAPADTTQCSSWFRMRCTVCLWIESCASPL